MIGNVGLHPSIIVELGISYQPAGDVMPTDVCRLCLKTKKLRESHLMPADMYGYVVGRTNIRNPIVVARNATVPGSKQVADYLLCAKGRRKESSAIVEVFHRKGLYSEQKNQNNG
jgi:hypothetical protein